MATTYLDRAKMLVSGTPGTGNITLGAAVSGYQTFAAAGAADGATIPYIVEDGSNFEYGYGTYTAASTTLARSNILGSSAGSNQAINASSNAIVTAGLLAEDILALVAHAVPAGGNKGQVLTKNSGSNYDVSWQTPSSGGGTTPTAPQKVQTATNSSDGSNTFTFNQAPTQGNLLIYIGVHFHNGPNLQTGWSFVYQNGGGDYGNNIAYKTAGANESTTQTPTDSSRDDGVMFEVSGGSTSFPGNGLSPEANGTTASISINSVPANSLVVGASIVTGGNALPSNISGATAGATSTNNAGVQAFTDTVTAAGTQTISVTYANAANITLQALAITVPS